MPLLVSFVEDLSSLIGFVLCIEYTHAYYLYMRHLSMQQPVMWPRTDKQLSSSFANYVLQYFLMHFIFSM